MPTLRRVEKGSNEEKHAKAIRLLIDNYFKNLPDDSQYMKSSRSASPNNKRDLKITIGEEENKAPTARREKSARVKKEKGPNEPGTNSPMDSEDFEFQYGKEGETDPNKKRREKPESKTQVDPKTSKLEMEAPHEPVSALHKRAESNNETKKPEYHGKNDKLYNGTTEDRVQGGQDSDHSGRGDKSRSPDHDQKGQVRTISPNGHHSKSREKPVPSYMRTKGKTLPLNSKIMITSMMTKEEKEHAKEMNKLIENERKLKVVKKMKTHEKIQLVLAKTKDPNEVKILQDMVKRGAVDHDFVDQRVFQLI